MNGGEELPKLRRPAPELLNAYLDFCRETWGHVHDSYILHDPARFDEWRNTIFDDYRKAESGIDLPPGIVPSTTRWLMADETCVGVVNLRPRLNEALAVYGGHIGLCLRPSARGQGLARALIPALAAEARKLGISELLLTTTADNLAGRRVNESIPGVRIERDTVMLGGKLTEIFRYRHTLAGENLC